MTRRKSFDQHWLGALGAYALMDLLLAGLGMGVPVFCILFGFSVGWFTAMRARVFRSDLRQAMRLNLRYALITTAVTFALMAVIWGRLVPVLFDPVIDYGSMGVPLILYEPRLSFIGWLVLMIFVAPALQFVVTLLGSYLTFLWAPAWWRDGVPTPEQHFPRPPWQRSAPPAN